MLLSTNVPFNTLQEIITFDLKENGNSKKKMENKIFFIDG